MEVHRNGYGIAPIGSGNLTYNFEGQFNEDGTKREGVMTLSNGDIFKGTFLNDQVHEGVMTFSTGDIFNGMFLNNLLHEGTVKYTNGRVFKGQFNENGTRREGALVFPDGLVYKGQFSSVNDKLHGKGTMKYTDGCVFKGRWENNEWAEGAYKCPDGGVAYGTWRNKRLHGWGNKQNINEPTTSLWGEFNNGELHGHGIVNFPDGNIYEGKLKNNKLHGYGTMKYADGNIFQGEWKTGKRVEGTMEYPNGNYVTGEFINNKFGGGKGSININIDGQDSFRVYRGPVNKNQLPDGNGTITHEDGSIYDGTWKDGVHIDGKYRTLKKFNKKCESLGLDPETCTKWQLDHRAQARNSTLQFKRFN